jgi:hypothetical protein
MGLRKSGALSILIVLSLCLAASGQASTATVSFTLDFPGSDPSHYEIVIGSDGQGSYVSNGKFDEKSDPANPVSLKFAVPDAIRTQVFDLSKRAHYFTGKVDSDRKNVANTGTKALIYKDGARTSRAVFNYSPLPPVQQLTALFQNLSATLEFGRRLVYLHKYEKLALDDELKRMEEMQRDNGLSDVQVVAPVLQGIADDWSVMNVSRSRALRLLATAGK